MSFWRRSLRYITKVLLFPIDVLGFMFRLVAEWQLAFYGSGEAIERFSKKYREKYGRGKDHPGEPEQPN